jgi:hypothetical protein
VSRRNDLTPRCKKFYKTVVESATKVYRLQSKIKDFKSRLANAENFADGVSFQHFSELNAPTQTFFLQQLRTQKLPPKGRRFSLEEKILALSLLKASGKGFRLLSKLFVLPSRRTLTNLLNQLPYRPGLNQHVFNALKQSVRKMKPVDRHCVVMFDEISISTGLTYSKKEDRIEGFEDLGHSAKCAFANSANVVMVRGIHRQWKQPISFTFSNGPIKATDLKKIITGAITACQNIGLKVVATVCDQGSANQAIINSLLADTKEKCLREGTENKHFGFVVNAKEIVPLFDVPHLLKCVRNNLLTKDLHFEINGEKKIAKWGHIEQFYNLDVSDDTRMCPKLTDCHILSDKINKMKVSLAAQVFSHQVGSLMKRIAKWGMLSITYFNLIFIYFFFLQRSVMNVIHWKKTRLRQLTSFFSWIRCLTV